MTTVHYEGLTWDHPRGYNALAAAAAELDESRDGLTINWSKHPLEGFESHPIDDLARRYDIVIIDHPHLGEAVNGDCFVPLEDMFAAEEISAWREATIGACVPSYFYAGRHWALPLDAAAQVMAYAPELLEDSAPADWQSVIELAHRVPVALSLAGPHAAISFMSICVALGEPPASRDPDVLVSRETGRAALEILTALAASAPDWSRSLNPTGLLDAMSRGERIAVVPLVFGYVNYATPAQAGRRAVRFANAPTAGGFGTPGSTLGGTGLAVSRRATVTPALLDHIRWLMSEGAQRGFIPAHDGQPSSRAAWTDAQVNGAWGNFYRDTEATLEAAWVRPRHDGYIAFQSDASAILRAGMASGTSAEAILSELQDRYASSRKAAGLVRTPWGYSRDGQRAGDERICR